MDPFHPIPGSTISISATTSSASAAFKISRTDRFQVRLYNAGAATVFVNRGGSSVAATTSSMPIPSGAVEVLTFDNHPADPVTHVAAITASGTATLYATQGEGF